MPTPFWASPRGVALILCGYLIAHFAVRMTMAPTLGLDDAEQALFAQHWLANYRYRAPPLFTWGLMGLGDLIGVNRVSISILRYLLLGITAGFLYLTARRLIRDPRLAALSTYSLAAIYVFAWYSHHDLTHTTTLAAGLAAAWYFFVRLIEEPRLRWYLGLGAAVGLGTLGKWNFVLFAAALPLACLILPEYRTRIANWRTVPALLLAGAIVAPSVLHALKNGSAPGDATGLILGEPEDLIEGLFSGTGDLALALFAYPQPFLILAAALFWPALRRAWRQRRAGHAGTPPDCHLRLVLLVMGLVAAFHFVLVLFAGATEFSERMMQPALIALPIAFFMAVERGGADAASVRRYLWVLAALVVGVLAGRVGVQLAGGDLCRGSCRAFHPYETIGAELGRAGFTGYGTVLAESFHIGGNIRVVFPQARVMTPDYPPATWPEPSGRGQCLLIWRKGAEPPADMTAYLRDDLGVTSAPTHSGTVTAPMVGAADKAFSLAYAFYEPDGGDCR